MSIKIPEAKLADVCKRIFLGLLAYMPFHILLSTWIGSGLNILEFMKVAKDGILVVGFLAALAASIRQPWFKTLLKDKLVQLILAFAALNVLLALFRPTDQDAEVLGVVYNTRFLLFFLYAVLLSKLFDAHQLKRQALKIVLAAGVAVLFFGVLQYTVLPDDALTNIGYERSNGVLPAFFIDDKPDLERAMSTLRDPNSLGSYIIIIGSLTLVYYLRSKNIELKKTLAWLFALSLLGLWFTFSRSAWLGFALAVATVILLSYRHKLSAGQLKKLIIGGVIGVVMLAALFYPLRNTYFVQNVVFHADEATVLEDPNQLRLRFWQESVQDVTERPLGHGPGTAGLTSIHNDEQGTILTENYYLQVAHETGVIGLTLFIGILALVGARLYALRDNPAVLGLLAAFAGLLLTNFLVHVWSNEAVAYTWWGLAGILLRPIQKK